MTVDWGGSSCSRRPFTACDAVRALREMRLRAAHMTHWHHGTDNNPSESDEDWGEDTSEADSWGRMAHSHFISVSGPRACCQVAIAMPPSHNTLCFPMCRFTAVTLLATPVAAKHLWAPRVAAEHLWAPPVAAKHLWAPPLAAGRLWASLHCHLATVSGWTHA